MGGWASLGLSLMLWSTSVWAGRGVDAYPGTVDAACKITRSNGAPFCSGTLVRSDNTGTGAIVTVGHCFTVSRVPIEQISVSCGCGPHGCTESFTADAKNSMNILGSATSTFDGLSDQGFLILKEVPHRVQPLLTGDLDTYFDPHTHQVRADSECIKGGFGDGYRVGQDFDQNKDLAVNWRAYPNFFRVSKIDLSNYNSHPEWFFSELVGEVSESLAHQVIYQVSGSAKPDYKKINAKIISQLIGQKKFRNSLLPGDSGSGLLCRKRGAKSFVLVATMVSIGFQNKVLMESKSLADTPWVGLNMFTRVLKDLQMRIRDIQMPKLYLESPMIDGTEVRTQIRQRFD